MNLNHALIVGGSIWLIDLSETMSMTSAAETAAPAGKKGPKNGLRAARV